MILKRRRSKQESDLGYLLELYLLKPHVRIFMVYWEGGWCPVSEEEFSADLHKYPGAERDAVYIAVSRRFGYRAEGSPDIVRCGAYAFRVGHKMSGFVLIPLSPEGEEIWEEDDEFDP